MDAKTVDEVLHFWFDELSSDDWWGGNDALDARIAERFGTLHERLASTDTETLLAACGADARVSLAHILVLDQMSRNIHRGTGQAFAQDDTALAISEQAVGNGLDAGMDTTRRGFLYMPFMHAEDLDAQNRGVELFATVSDYQRDFAVQHRDIVERFGRFPHRNDALGRTTTPEEEAFLVDGPRFGQ